jgi:hypothetical protein
MITEYLVNLKVDKKEEKKKCRTDGMNRRQKQNGRHNFWVILILIDKSFLTKIG